MTEESRQKQVMDRLRRERDELRLQAELGKAELKDEWEALEKKWGQLEHRMAAAAGEARDASHDVGAAMGLLMEELGESYRRIRGKLSQKN